MESNEADFFEKGPWSGVTLDIVVPFYNEESNIHKTHQSNKRLENLFHVRNYVYVDNGSKDKTRSLLEDLARSDAKVKVVVVETNTGYGDGMKAGLLAASADYILTNHADMQFDSYTFFTQNLPVIKAVSKPCSVFPYRTNRPLSDRAFSFFLRSILSGFQFKRIYDFNGQPKLFPRVLPNELIRNFPKDFSFDFAVYSCFHSSSSLRLPVFQKDRLSGVSSWNINYFARFRQIRNWLLMGFRISFQGKYSALREFQRNGTRSP